MIIYGIDYITSNDVVSRDYSTNAHARSPLGLWNYCLAELHHQGLEWYNLGSWA